MSVGEILNLPYGKVPPEILEAIVFQNLGVKREDVIIGPSRGEDAAIIKVNNKLIACSCDPISGAVERIGWLAVNVSANDVATRGVKPQWIISCMLLPKNITKRSFVTICQQMNNAAKKLDLAIIGGHSEVTPGLSNPLIITSCFGVTEGKKYFVTSGVEPGSNIVLTKGVGIEGTGILACDKKELVMANFGGAFTKRSVNYLDMISVVPEALIASKIPGVNAMHDPTEGGVLGGLFEMSDASRCGFILFEKNLIIHPETEAISDLFKIDPLQLISSGSLLISVQKKAAERLLETLKEQYIEAAIIGEFMSNPQQRVLIKKDGSKTHLSAPKTDALWAII